jgi:hypothetical protein
MDTAAEKGQTPQKELRLARQILLQDARWVAAMCSRGLRRGR